VAINSENPKGKLETLIMDNFFANFKDIAVFIERMWVTEQLKEKWYGDEIVAETMGYESKIRKYICSIKTLSIDGCNLSDG
jgi:hypothetical protein